MNKILGSIDLISVEHLPIQNLLNLLYSSKNLIIALKYLSKHIGYGTDLGGFTFWSDLDEYDKTHFYEQEFDGIEIEYMDETINVNYEILYHYLKIVVERYIEENPQEQREIEICLKSMKENLNIKENIQTIERSQKHKLDATFEDSE
jgi:hypothetical protein